MADESRLRALVSQLEECLARNEKGRAQKVREELQRLGWRGRVRGVERAIPSGPSVEERGARSLASESGRLAGFLPQEK